MSKKMELRLYDNPMYGSTCGKGLYRTALFNGSLDILEPRLKYLVDLYDFDVWQHKAKTVEQMEILRYIIEENLNSTLLSWIVEYDMSTKVKRYTCGFLSFDPITNNSILWINDIKNGIRENWSISLKPCKDVVDKRVPTLWATNKEYSI